MINVECSVIDINGDPITVRNQGIDSINVVLTVGDKTVIVNTEDLLDAIATAGKVNRKIYHHRSYYSN